VALAKKVGRAGSIFLSDSYKFAAKEMGAQNSNFASICAQNWGFQPQMLQFWARIIRQDFQLFSDSQKFRGTITCWPASFLAVGKCK